MLSFPCDAKRKAGKEKTDGGGESMRDYFSDFDSEEIKFDFDFEEPEPDSKFYFDETSEEELNRMAEETKDLPEFTGEPPEEYICLPGGEYVSVRYIETLVESCPSIARRTLRKMKIKESLKAWRKEKDASAPKDIVAALKRAKKCKEFDIDAYIEACEENPSMGDDRDRIFWLMDHWDDEY
jgi:hypothetical protein